MSVLTVVSMFDSVTPDIPKHVQAKAGYVAGNFPTWTEKWFQAIVAEHALSIAIHLGEDADVLDIEAGDAAVTDAPQFVLDRRKVGRRAIFYCSLSDVMTLISLLASNGFVYGVDYYVWSAHYTDKPHICDAACGFGLDRQVHGTQWTDRAKGLNLDQSLVLTEIFSLGLHPEYAVLDTTLRKLKGGSLKKISELGRVKTYDRMAPGFDRKFVENDCLLLFNRLWAVVHEDGKLEPNSAKAKHNWTLYNRGERGRILWAAAHGKR